MKMFRIYSPNDIQSRTPSGVYCSPFGRLSLLVQEVRYARPSLALDDRVGTEALSARSIGSSAGAFLYINNARVSYLLGASSSSMVFIPEREIPTVL